MHNIGDTWHLPDTTLIRRIFKPQRRRVGRETQSWESLQKLNMRLRVLNELSASAVCFSRRMGRWSVKVGGNRTHFRPSFLFHRE